MEILIRHFEDDIFRFFLFRLKNESDAGDCSQEVFLKMLRGFPSYTNEGRLRSWLFTIARNEWIDFSKRERRIVSFGDRGETVEEQASEDETLVRRDNVLAVRDCVQRLPDHEGEVLQLRLSDDLTFREIADALDRPLNSVLSQMRRATGRMKECLRKKGIER